jgi:hypothetical protein
MISRESDVQNQGKVSSRKKCEEKVMSKKRAGKSKGWFENWVTRHQSSLVLSWVLSPCPSHFCCPSLGAQVLPTSLFIFVHFSFGAIALPVAG